MNTRRTWVVGGAAALAAAAGAAAWFWRSRQDPPGVDAWSLVFDTPDGGQLALASLRGRPLVLNFWATWCPPCVREMPTLDRFHREYQTKGWQVVGIAADSADKVREFVARTPVSYPLAVAGFAGVALSRQLGNLSGGLPFTAVFDSAGRLVRRHMGEVHAEQLAAWAAGNS